MGEHATDAVERGAGSAGVDAIGKCAEAAAPVDMSSSAVPAAKRSGSCSSDK